MTSLRSGQRKGFTFVELLVSIVLLALTVPALCMMVNSGIQAIFESVSRCEAFNLARNELEKARNLGYSRLGDAFYQGYEGTDYDLRRRVSIIAGLPNGAGEGIKRVTVNVNVPASGKELALLTTDITGGM